MAADNPATEAALDAEPQVRVRHLNKRDLNRTWEFIKAVFREVNRSTVEYQRPKSKKRFLEVFDEKGIEQLLFVIRAGGKERIVGYAECALTIIGTDNWMNERYFRARDMRPLFVEELAVDPEFQGRGLGTFVLEQLEHLAKLRGCTHLVLPRPRLHQAGRGHLPRQDGGERPGDPAAAAAEAARAEGARGGPAGGDHRAVRAEGHAAGRLGFAL